MENLSNELGFRIEKDFLGEIKVPSDKFWGAQTQRSLQNFKISEEIMPWDVIKALVYIKEACAEANYRLGKLDEKRKESIIHAANYITENSLKDNFPLRVWQTGSGTQTNMNVNEVISHICNENSSEEFFVHPNDHVNMSQSSNDTFPSAMKVAALCSIENYLIPAAKGLIKVFKNLEEENKDVVKIGRTHLQDAVPIGFFQEISGWRALTEKSLEAVIKNMDFLREIPIGGTAVGTGINCPKGFDEKVCEVLSSKLSTKITPEKNKIHSLTGMDAFVIIHGAMKSLAANLMKIANDIRFLASGPRCGIGEISIPQNEPGSSIMPGKVNPTQCEAITMIAVQVIANDLAVGMAASQGNFELNVFMPVCIYNFLQSVRLLSDGINSFTKNCVCGIKPIKKVMEGNLEKSLMNVTAFNSKIGYENSVKIAKLAFKEDLSLKQAALKLGFLSEDEIDKILDPKNMI